MSDTVPPGLKTPSKKPRHKNPSPNNLSALSDTEFQEPGSQSKKNQTNNPNTDYQIRKKIDFLHAKADFQEKRLKQIQTTLETIKEQFCNMVDNVNNHMENTTQDLTDIKDALTWLQTRARLNTKNSDASDVENKSYEDSNDDGFATPSDSIDEPNEDKDSIASRLHTNSTKKAPRN